MEKYFRNFYPPPPPSNIRILKIYPAPLFSHLEIKVFLQVQLAHHLPLYYDFYRQRIRKKGIKFRMNLQVGDPDPDFTFLHVPPRDSRDGISYNDATREEDWNCLPKIFSFFFSLSLNKFAIKMFHPTIRKKGRRKIWNSKHYTSSIFQIFLFIFSHSKIARSLVTNFLIIRWWYLFAEEEAKFSR